MFNSGSILNIKYNFIRFILLALIIVFSGCFKQAKKNNFNDAKPRYTVFSFKDEARLFDVPFPAGIELWNLGETSDDRKLAIKFESDFQNLSKFYKREMEYLGWQNIGELKIKTRNETCFVFQKHSKTCIVFIKDLDKGSREKAKIFIMPNKYI